MASFRRRDSDATRQPEPAPVLPTDPLLSVQRPPYLKYVQAKNALTAAGEVVPVGQGDGQVRETLAELRNSGFLGCLPLEPHLAMAGRFGAVSALTGSRLAYGDLKDLLEDLSVQ